MGWLTRNWHLKLAALGLATILYTGFVYSGSFTDQLFPGLPIEAINQPSGAYPLTQQLGTVDVQYRVAADAPERVTADSFAVTVDLGEYDMERSPVQSLPFASPRSSRGWRSSISSRPPWRSRSTAWPSARCRSRSRLASCRRAWPSAPRTSHEEVTASGPQSQLGRVDRAVAQVPDLRLGHRRAPAAGAAGAGRHRRPRGGIGGADPATIQVEIDVRAVETSKTVPIRPVLTGNPADGFQINAVTVDPAVVTIFGARRRGGRSPRCPPSRWWWRRTRTSSSTTLDLPEDTAPPRMPTPVVTVNIQALDRDSQLPGGRDLRRRAERLCLPAPAGAAVGDAARPGG